jgi:hypothetical protein
VHVVSVVSSVMYINVDIVCLEKCNVDALTWFGLDLM